MIKNAACIVQDTSELKMEKSTINILSAYELWVKIPTDFLVKWTADNMMISFQWNKWYSVCKKKKKTIGVIIAK